MTRFSYLRAAADAEPAVHERAAKAREGLQKQIDLIAATPAFEWVKSSAIDSVLAFIERDRIQRIGGR